MEKRKEAKKKILGQKRGWILIQLHFEITGINCIYLFS